MLPFQRSARTRTCLPRRHFPSAQWHPSPPTLTWLPSAGNDSASRSGSQNQRFYPIRVYVTLHLFALPYPVEQRRTQHDILKPPIRAHLAQGGRSRHIHIAEVPAWPVTNGLRIGEPRVPPRTCLGAKRLDWSPSPAGSGDAGAEQSTTAKGWFAELLTRAAVVPSTTVGSDNDENFNYPDQHRANPRLARSAMSSDRVYGRVDIREIRENSLMSRSLLPPRDRTIVPYHTRPAAPTSLNWSSEVSVDSRLGAGAHGPRQSFDIADGIELTA